MAAEESQALVRFVTGWAPDGISDDGLPRFRETIRIIKSIPPLTEIEREAEPRDFEDNPGPWQLFEKEQASRSLEPGQKGFPLALWPAVGPAMLRMLSARDIVTVEALAAAATRSDMPADFVEIAKRAKAMLALSENLGKYEEMIRDRDGQLAALNEQVVEMRGTISAQNSMINALKAKAA